MAKPCQAPVIASSARGSPASPSCPAPPPQQNDGPSQDGVKEREASVIEPREPRRASPAPHQRALLEWIEPVP